jgi:hypothetical protein
MHDAVRIGAGQGDVCTATGKRMMGLTARAQRWMGMDADHFILETKGA